MTAKMLVGKIIAGFTLEEQLHSGGMATIWRVSKPGMDLPMVMKIPRLTEGYEPSFIVTFEAEQMILPRLHGLHVPHCVALGEITDDPFLVMEHILGPSLAEQMMAAPFNVETIAHLGTLIANAIHDIHSQHVIHLDIAPGNILFRTSGEAVLIDFGLSRHDQLPDLMDEEFHLPMGTAPYIAPEQVLNIRNDPRSDIFALGVILYQCVTGEQPFGDPSSLAGLKRRLYIDPIAPQLLNQSCPGWLQEIILCCLEVEPKARYQSAAHLAFALQHPAQVVITHPAQRPPQKFWTRWQRWLLSIILVPEATIKTSIPRHLATVPIIMVAVDVMSPDEALAEAVRQEVALMMNYAKKARLTCITIRKMPIIGIDFGVDEAGENLFVQYLVKLKYWARPLNLAPERISFHVIEGVDPAVTLVHYAATNNVEHIVIGAKGHSTLHRILGNVASHVVIAAPCTVTVVRIRANNGATSGDAAGYASHG